VCVCVCLASLDSTLTQSGIPFIVRAPIYHSVPSINRNIISQFHQQIFEIQPFELYSLHLFTKSHPEEVYSIFSFTLRREGHSKSKRLFFLKCFLTNYLMFKKKKKIQKIPCMFRAWSVLMHMIVYVPIHVIGHFLMNLFL
jgi:hypothetical protein